MIVNFKKSAKMQKAQYVQLNSVIQTRRELFQTGVAPPRDREGK